MFKTINARDILNLLQMMKIMLCAEKLCRTLHPDCKSLKLYP